MGRKSVTIVGLGIIGGAVSRHLSAAGWDVGGVDLSSEACAKAESGGATIIDIDHAAAHAPIILTSLPSAASVRQVIRDIAAQTAGPVTVAEMSTLALADKLALQHLVADSPVTLLDCPVSGTGAQAATKDIAIYASGDDEGIAAAEPVFAGFSKACIRLGAYGQGSRMKLIANLLVAIHNVAAGEAIALAEAAGLDLEAVIAAVAEGAGNSRIFELRAPLMAARTYEPATMKLDVWAKDLDAIGAFASELNAKTPLLDATAPYYAAATARSPAWDTAAVCEALRAVSERDKGDGKHG